MWKTRVLVLCAALGAVTLTNAAPASAASFGAGVVMRPMFCMKNCEGTLFSFGPEVTWKWVSVAWRFAFDSGVTWHMPDIRFMYEIGLGPIGIAPLVEFSPMFAKSSGFTITHLTLRPGVRFYYKPIPLLALFIEPVAFDIGLYTSASGNGASASSTETVLRYNLGFGAAVRF